MQFMNRIAIGDWSRDGHGFSETFTFRSTHNGKDIRAAYLDRVKEIGLALHEQQVWQPPARPLPAVLCEFGDNLLSRHHQEIFAGAGIDFSKVEGNLEPNGDISPTPQGAATLFLEIVKTKIEDFDYMFIEDNPLNVGNDVLSVFIGYGLF